MHHVHTTLISSTNRTSTLTKIWNSQIHRQTFLVTTETSSVCYRGCRRMAWVSTAGPKPHLAIAPINLNHSLLTPQIELPLSKYLGKILATLMQFWLVSRYLGNKGRKDMPKLVSWVEAEILNVQQTSSTEEILVWTIQGSE